MVIPNKSIPSRFNFEDLCDYGIVFSLCALIFVLPASIALLDSFAGLAIFIYLIKKIYRLAINWPLKTSSLNLPAKAHFIWKSFAPPDNFLNAPLRILTLAIFISVVFSHYPFLSFLAFFGKFLKGVFLYFCMIEALNNEKHVWFFLNSFLVSAFITTLSGVAQHYTGKDFLKGHLVGTENLATSPRISSSFATANGFGVYLVPVIAMVLHFLYRAVARQKSWILGGVLAVLLGLSLACFCWTYSRSAWGGYLCVLFLMVWMDRRKAIYTAALVLVFCFVFLPSLNQMRNLNLLNDNSSGTRVQNENLMQSIKPAFNDIGSGRQEYWKKAISIIRSSPVTGTGLNTYTKILHKDPDPTTWHYAHNGYLQLTAETGSWGWFVFYG